MNQLPNDPLTPATKSQEFVVGIASLFAGIAFLALSALTIVHTHSSGRLTVPAVIFLICLMMVFALGFLGVAFAILRSRKKREARLMGNATLYLVGGFLIVVPLGALALSLWKGSEEDLSSGFHVFSMMGIGLLAIRLARIRGRKVPERR